MSSYRESLLNQSRALVPIWAPHYGAPISVAFRRFWQKYATFAGRASRSEFWWWILSASLIYIALGVIYAAFPSPALRANGTLGVTHLSIGAEVMNWVYVLWLVSTLLPTLALIVRRPHDANFRAWFLFLALVPLAGALALLVLMILPSQKDGERFDRPRPATYSLP